jgi:hypothetical protein
MVIGGINNMADINTLRKVLFVDGDTKICTGSGEYIDDVARSGVSGVCNHYDDQASYENAECVESVSHTLRLICGSPKLLGDTWLKDGQVRGPYDVELKRVLDRIYDGKTNLQKEVPYDQRCE